MNFRCIVLRECVQIINANINDIKVLQEQKRIFNEHINALIEGAKNTEQPLQPDSGHSPVAG